MRILLVKTSSLGDVIHNLPVATDLMRSFPDAHIDWCVEESFSAIPKLHPAISNVIPVAIRRWRKNLFRRGTWHEIGAFYRQLKASQYDAILDTQGLIKSALIASGARGVHYGYAAEVAREPFAATFYDKTFVIPPNAHAVERNRWLSAAAFDYPVDLPLDYGLSLPHWAAELYATPFAVLLTATSRDDKLWPEAHWVEIAKHLITQGVSPIFPSGNAKERERATRIADATQCVTSTTENARAIVAPAMQLSDLAALLKQAVITVGVDTGLAHLSVAVGTPTIALYVATDPALTGVYGNSPIWNLGGRNQTPSPQAVIDLLTKFTP